MKDTNVVLEPDEQCIGSLDGIVKGFPALLPDMHPQRFRYTMPGPDGSYRLNYHRPSVVLKVAGNLLSAEPLEDLQALVGRTDLKEIRFALPPNDYWVVLDNISRIGFLD